MILVKKKQTKENKKKEKRKKTTIQAIQVKVEEEIQRNTKITEKLIKMNDLKFSVTSLAGTLAICTKMQLRVKDRYEERHHDSS